MNLSSENYSNLKLGTTPSMINSPSINDIEMNSQQLTDEDPENPDTKVFHIKPCASSKLSVDLNDFKMRHCRRIRSILFNERKYNSIYHPKDDTHAFYIVRDKKGIFSLQKGAADEVRKKQMVKEQINEFIIKLNYMIGIQEISQELKKKTLYKTVLIAITCVFLILLAFSFLNIVFFLFSFLIGSHNGKFTSGDHQEEHHTFLDKFFIITLFIVSIITLYAIIRVLRHIKSKEKFLLFTFIKNKKEKIELEIEYLNNTVLYPINMKCQLSDTCDYLQIFYDKNIIYEIGEHFK